MDWVPSLFGRRVTAAGTVIVVTVMGILTVSTLCPLVVLQRTATFHGIPNPAPPHWLPHIVVVTVLRNKW